MFKWFILNVHGCIAYIAGSGDADIEDLTMNNLVFIAGTEPFGAGSQMCLNFSIIDDQLVEPTERFTVCGRSSQNAVVILNNGCTDIKIRDNDGVYYHVIYRRMFILYIKSIFIVLISPTSPDDIYTVEVQRELLISCLSPATPKIVQWISKLNKFPPAVSSQVCIV